VHGYRQAAAEHAARIADSVVAVHRVVDRNRMDQVAVVAGGVFARQIEHAPDVGVADFVAVDRHLDRHARRTRLAARDVDQNVVDALIRHLFGGVDRGADRGFGLVHVHHGAVLDAARPVMADAENPRIAVVAGTRNEAGNLGRADVERGDGAVARAGFCHSLLV